jgi:hypothetical protein
MLIGGLFFIRSARWRIQNPDEKLIDEALALEGDDPVASDRMLDRVFAARAESDLRELERLRHEARGNPVAAEQLLRKLQETLRQRGDARRHFEAHMANDPRLASVLRNIDDANAETKALLVEVEGRLRQLRP